jgi:hypothetical protein
VRYCGLRAWHLEVARSRLPTLRLNECVAPEFRDILHDGIVRNRREIVPLLETCLWNSQDQGFAWFIWGGRRRVLTKRALRSWKNRNTTQPTPCAVYAVESQVRTAETTKKPQRGAGAKEQTKEKVVQEETRTAKPIQKRAPPTVRNYHLEKQLGRVGSSSRNVRHE